MEEIYIVKLKGLPPPSVPSQDSLSKDSKTSFYYHTDLTAEAIRGFSYLHIFFGITVLCLSVTNLCFHENPLSLEPPLGITVWCAIAFIILGFFGILTAYKRKCDLSGSIFYVKFQLVLIVIVLSLTLTFAILFVLDLHGPIANQFIGLNIVFSIIVETVILLLTLFTCARVLWPGCINFCAKDWPMQPSLKRKMIVKTNVFTNGIQQDKASIIQSFGPNCVISLNMPPANAASESVLSSKNSSICSSPTYKISSQHKTTCSLSGSTSDLAKSLSTIYAIPDESIMQQAMDNSQPKEQITTIATNSIYYNYPSVAVSTTNLLQTFPNAGQQNREQSSTTTVNNQQQKAQQQHCSIYQHDSSTNNSSDHSWYRGSSGDSYSAAESEEIDPYDTDEFDYCSSTTEDEQDNDNHIMNHHHVMVNHNDECHKSSSDDGNGTLEEDSKSLTNSESSHTQSTASELVTSDEGGSFSPNKDHHHFTNMDQSKIQLKHNNDIVAANDVVEVDDHQDEQTNRSMQIEIKQPDNKLKFKLYSIKKAIENIENQANNKSNCNDDDNDDEIDGVVQDGEDQSLDCIGNPIDHHENRTDGDERPPINQIEVCSFNNNGNKPKQTPSTTPYKSSIIKIESPPINGTTNANIDTQINNKTTKTSVPEQKPPSSTTTIRLLNTNKVSSTNKFNNRLPTEHHNASDNHHESSNLNSSSLTKMSSKLASHPYLCRLRATTATTANNTNTDQCFERRYPKYLVNCTNNTDSSSSSKSPSPSSCTSTSLSSSSSSPTTINSKPNFMTVTSKAQAVNLIESHHLNHRIPDIQRV